MKYRRLSSLIQNQNCNPLANTFKFNLTQVTRGKIHFQRHPYDSIQRISIVRGTIQKTNSNAQV